MTPQLDGALVTQPVLFIAGEKDLVLKPFQGVEGTKLALNANCIAEPRCVFYPGRGHWIQVEEAAAVNAELVAFLNVHLPPPPISCKL